jgi:hypothetical protein
MTHDKLRKVVREAWGAVGGAEELQRLIRTMPERCQAVIDADGNHRQRSTRCKFCDNLLHLAVTLDPLN